IPQGLALHDYANLYIHARNPMMSRLVNSACAPIVVLRIDPLVLDIPGTVIADGNAAADHTRLFPAPAGLANLDHDRVYARWWLDDNQVVYWEKKRIRCAEVLVPHRIAVGYLKGAYVRDQHGMQACESLAIARGVNTDVFFG